MQVGSTELQSPVSKNKLDKASANRSNVLLALAEALNETEIVSIIEDKSGILTDTSEILLPERRSRLAGDE